MRWILSLSWLVPLEPADTSLRLPLALYLGKARRVSLQPVSDQPASEAMLTPAPAAAASEAVTITLATAAASAANPATPLEALQAPITEEELAYRRDLHEHLSKFSDEVLDGMFKPPPPKWRQSQR